MVRPEYENYLLSFFESQTLFHGIGSVRDSIRMLAIGCCVACWSGSGCF